MGGSPKVVEQDPEGDAKKAADKATTEANLKKSQRRTGSALGQGLSDTGATTKTTLGGGA